MNEEPSTTVPTGGDRDGANPARTPASSPPPAWATAGQVLAGRYTVLGELGYGGLGVVLAAYDARLDRRVALKRLHPASAAPASRSPELERRLEREARAMARLNHPNVVAVYDIQVLDDGSVLIAMEHVPGQTLRQWRRAQPRRWQEVLRVYLEAGRGLAAAHAAGLVHRDFKPDNALLGDDGRVRVTDFGLALLDDVHRQAAAAPAATPGASAGLSIATAHGSILGTPMYLAPEVLQGGAASPLTDLYSFCVALYEALWGQQPSPGSEISEALASRLLGEVLAPPPEAGVPVWVTRAVLRGLRVEPVARPASMQELLRALEDDPRPARRRRMAAGAVAVLVLAALNAYAWGQRRIIKHCDQEALQIDQAWGPDAREKVRAALRSPGAGPAGDASIDELLGRLDGHRDSWVAMYREACRAARLDHTQSREEFALRSACLDQRRASLETIAQTLAAADERVRRRAPDLVSRTEDVSPCANLAALSAPIAPRPGGEEEEERLRAVRRQVAVAQALELSGKVEEGQETIERAVAGATSLGYPPALAEALRAQGDFLVRTDLGDAVGAYHRAVLAAEEGRHDAEKVRAAGRLASALSALGRYQEAHAWAQLGEAAARRMEDRTLEYEVVVARGPIFNSEARFREALASFRREEELATALFGATHPRRATVLASQSETSNLLGEHEQALRLGRQALEIALPALGPDHPDVALIRSELGAALMSAGQFAEAREELGKAHRTYAASYGPDSTFTQALLDDQAELVLREGKLEEAIAQARARVAERDRLFGPDDHATSNALDLLGEGLLANGRPREAIAPLERALRLIAATRAAPPASARSKFLLAQALWEARDRPRAASLANEAAQAYAAAQSPRREQVQRWLQARALTIDGGTPR